MYSLEPLEKILRIGVKRFQYQCRVKIRTNLHNDALCVKSHDPGILLMVLHSLQAKSVIRMHVMK